MEKILASFTQYPDYYLAGGVAIGLLLLLWLIVLVRNVLNISRSQMIELKLEEQKDAILLAVAQSQSSMQDSLNASLMQLQNLMDERLMGLQRQLLQDGANLKGELVARFTAQQKTVTEALADGRLAQQRHASDLKQGLEDALSKHREVFAQHQREALRSQQEAFTSGMESMARQVNDAFKTSSGELSKRLEALTKTNDERLKEISGQVEKRLTQGFEKTTETFSKVLEHLSRIDEAQKKITELSSNVVSLQEVLTDKRSRGAFGEVQLAGLVRNVMPEKSFDFQQTLSNGTRVDCLLYLPEPTGNVAIDAKFPLESFQTMMDGDLPDDERKRAQTQFKKDIKKHIKDISEKYLIAGETAEGAVMFLPAEAIFAEIHAHHPELVEDAQRLRVWMVSPTTLMAVLTTARAVLKDEATRKQIHIIQDHLRLLSTDFGRFQDRMDNLSKHIDQAHRDVGQIHISAKKITSRFTQIEQVELDDENSIKQLAASAPKISTE